MNNIIFFGPPGAGKGTQAKLISDFLNLPHLSTGDILRLKIQKKDNLALQLQSIMSSGELVSDSILNEIVSERLIDCDQGFILDGYPRTLDQSNFLNNFMNKSAIGLNFIFNIEIGFEILRDRILKRSKEEGRDDDNLNAIEIRYKAYTSSTKLVSDFYKRNNLEIFHEIDGDNQIEEITYKIKKIQKK